LHRPGAKAWLNARHCRIGERNERAIAPARRPIAGVMLGRRGACLAVKAPPAAC
jgi:hypothetical protein